MHPKNWKIWTKNEGRAPPPYIKCANSTIPFSFLQNLNLKVSIIFYIILWRLFMYIWFDLLPLLFQIFYNSFIDFSNFLWGFFYIMTKIDFLLWITIWKIKNRELIQQTENFKLILKTRHGPKIKYAETARKKGETDQQTENL